MSSLDTTVGLTNMGNTCFLNAALQALMRCTATGPFFLAGAIPVRAESNKREMVVAFQTLMRDFWAVPPPLPGQRPSLMPGGFLQSLYRILHETGDDWHRRGQQSDAAEAIQHILEYLHDGMYRSVKMEMRGPSSTETQKSQMAALASWAQYYSKEYSEIIRDFQGQTRIRVKCGECGNQTEQFEPYLMIKAPIPGAEISGATAPTGADCVAGAYAPATINDYVCTPCGKRTNAVKQESISRLPPVCLMSLKRFVNVPRPPFGHELKKVRGRIEWDLDAFDMAPWMAFPRNPFTGTAEPSVLTTMAIIEHWGTLRAGHYRMFARTSTGWICCDDSSVAHVSQSEVITEDSYVAFMIPQHKVRAQMAAFEASVDALRSGAAAATGAATGAAATGATAAATGAATAAAATGAAAVPAPAAVPLPYARPA
jgi:ubiquitin C-terminal hydrolase